MATCSICANVESANVINELLEKETALDVIAEKTGLHRSSIHRHSKKCYPAWRAARLKARRKNDTGTGRLIVSWPERDGGAAHYSYGNEILHERDVQPTDIIFAVRYAPPFDPATRADQNRTRVSD